MPDEPPMRTSRARPSERTDRESGGPQPSQARRRTFAEQAGEPERAPGSRLVEGARRLVSPRPTDADSEELAAIYRQRRLAIVAAAGALILLLIAVVATRGGEDPPPDRSRVLPIDAWAPYWTLDETTPEFANRASIIREISPFWFEATGAATVGPSPNLDAEKAEAFLDVARKNGVPIVPSIVDAMPAGGMAAVLADPSQRTVHVDTLVAFAKDQKAAGLDLDYEQFAFADDRATWTTTRPNWTAFITELAGRLHAENVTLTVSIPPVYDGGQSPDSGYWVYDYAGIAPHVDRIRVMAYDFSTSSPGPIAPLEWVRKVIAGVSGTTGTPEKIVLGIPLYGYNWQIGVTGTCPEGQENKRTTLNHRAFDELIAKRGAVPIYDAPTGEVTFNYQLVLTDGVTTCTEARQVWFVDPTGAALRKQLALEAGFAGVSLWALGFDSEATWANLAPPPPASVPPSSIG